MGDMVEAQGTVESSTESLSQNYSYVVHGAEAFCPMGSRAGRLTLPIDRGTFMHDMPIMTVQDGTEGSNVKCFGFCNSISNPDRLKEVEAVMKKVEDDKNLLDGIMDGLSFLGNAIASVFGFSDDPDPNDPYHGYGEDVYKSVLVCCDPLFAIEKKWDGGTDRLIINNRNALNSNCRLICLKDCDNGVVQIMNDGQENAANEQAGAADMASWKPGDPYPQPTQGNLEALDSNIADLKEKLKTETNPYERQKLENEIKGKEQLRDEMQSTMTMLYEMKQNAANLGAEKMMLDAKAQESGSWTEEEAKQYAEASAAYQQSLEDMQAVKDAFANGTPIAPVSEEKLSEDLNKVCEVRKNEDELNAYLGNNASDTSKIYCNGKLMTQAEYNQYTVDYANEVMPEVKRSWLTGEVISDEPKEMTTAEKVWDALIPEVKMLEQIPM